MDAQLEAKLIECLDALAQGESIERILSRYPQEAAQLRPLLDSAAGLRALRMEPSEAARMQSRQKFLAQADLLRRTKQRKTMGFLPRFATGFIAAALVAGVLGTGAVAASGSALPGDPLYGLKRTMEEVQLNTASSPTQRQTLQREFEQRRRDETNELLDARRQGEVAFTGTIEAIQPRAWIVSSLVVQLDARTQIVGTPQIDRVAEVRGATGPQGLRASSISIESSGEPGTTPTPEATETPQATQTPEPPESTAPMTTVTPQPSTPRPPAAAPRSTATSQPAATSHPVEASQPEATPQPAEVEFNGNVNSITEGVWSIDSTTVSVDNNTEIQGAINTGQRVKVKALRFADGRLVAVSIEISGNRGTKGDPNSNANQNSNENQNSNSGNSNDNSGNTNNNDANNHDGGGNHNGNDNSGNHSGNTDGNGN